MVVVLRRMGLVGAETPHLVPLTGGVASDIYRVELAGRCFVVKRAPGQAAGCSGLAGACGAQWPGGRLAADRRSDRACRRTRHPRPRPGRRAFRDGVAAAGNPSGLESGAARRPGRPRLRRSGRAQPRADPRWHGRMARPLGQLILTAGALLVVLDLLRRGLADLDNGKQAQVPRLHLGGVGRHGRAPRRRSGLAPSGGASAPPGAGSSRHAFPAAGASRSWLWERAWLVCADDALPCSRTNRTKARKLLGDNNAGTADPSSMRLSVQACRVCSRLPPGNSTLRYGLPSRTVRQATRTTCPHCVWPRWLMRTQSAWPQ